MVSIDHGYRTNLSRLHSLPPRTTRISPADAIQFLTYQLGDRKLDAAIFRRLDQLTGQGCKLKRADGRVLESYRSLFEVVYPKSPSRLKPSTITIFRFVGPTDCGGYVWIMVRWQRS